MSNFKNMKIPIENNLDEIVAELERLGYKPLNHLSCRSCHEWIVASGLNDRYYKPATIAELKEM